MTALISVIPIVLLIVLMMGFKVSGYRSAIVTLVVTILLALFAVPNMGIVPEKFAETSIYGITLWSVAVTTSFARRRRLRPSRRSSSR